MVPDQHVSLPGADPKGGARDDGCEVLTVVNRNDGVLVPMPQLDGNPDVFQRKSPWPRKGSDVLDITPRARSERFAQGVGRSHHDLRH